VSLKVRGLRDETDTTTDSVLINKILCGDWRGDEDSCFGHAGRPGRDQARLFALREPRQSFNIADYFIFEDDTRAIKKDEVAPMYPFRRSSDVLRDRSRLKYLQAS